MVIGAGSTVDEASQRIEVSEQNGTDGPGRGIDGFGPKMHSEQEPANNGGGSSPARRKTTKTRYGSPHEEAVMNPRYSGNPTTAAAVHPRKKAFATLTALVTAAVLLTGLAACGQPVLTAIAAGSGHICGLRENNSITCWAINDRYNKSPARSGEDRPPKGDNFTAISTSGNHACALRDDGTAVCWGVESDGQTPPPPGETFTTISSGYAHTCALKRDGTPVCWGNNKYDQVEPPSGAAFIAISGGGNHTCALEGDGTPVCWGDIHRHQHRALLHLCPEG